MVGFCPLIMLCGHSAAWAGTGDVLDAVLQPHLSEFSEEQVREVREFHNNLDSEEARRDFVISLREGMFETSTAPPALSPAAAVVGVPVIANTIDVNPGSGEIFFDTFDDQFSDGSVFIPGTPPSLFPFSGFDTDSTSDLDAGNGGNGVDDFLGDERDTTFTATGGTTTQGIANSAAITNSQLSLSSAEPNSAITIALALEYSGGILDSGFDITGGGANNSFLLQVVTVDANPFDIEVTFTSGSSSATASQSFLFSGGATEEDVLIPFTTDNFNVTGPATLDAILQDIDGARLEVSTDTALDITLDTIAFVEEVPFEMESAAGLGLLGLGAAWKLRRRKLEA